MPDRVERRAILRFRALHGALDRLTIRGVLFVGFGLLLALWLVSGVDLVRRLTEVETRASAVSARLIRIEELLSTIRAQVLLGSVYLRDALLDSPETTEYYRDQLQRTRTMIDQALAGYVPAIDSPGERATFSQLKREVFQLIAEGRANKETADLLFISVSTVETHRAHILEKLDLHSAAEIVLYAVRKGVIT